MKGTNILKYTVCLSVCHMRFSLGNNNIGHNMEENIITPPCYLPSILVINAHKGGGLEAMHYLSKTKIKSGKEIGKWSEIFQWSKDGP